MSTIPSCIQNSFNAAKPYLSTALTEGTDLVSRVAINTLATVGLGLVFGPSIGIAGGVVCGITSYLSVKSIDQLTYKATSKTFTSFQKENKNDIGIYSFFECLAKYDINHAEDLSWIETDEDKTAAQNILNVFLENDLPTSDQIQEACIAASSKFKKTAKALCDHLLETTLVNKCAVNTGRAIRVQVIEYERAFSTKCSDISDAPGKALGLMLGLSAISKIFLLIFAPIAAISLTKFTIIWLTGVMIVKLNEQINPFKQPSKTDFPYLTLWA